ncbi:MAG TPA: hypothetical protein VF698_20340 [Thermoanaerobaculia bacterium]|jgi:hypothetical protein
MRRLALLLVLFAALPLFAQTRGGDLGVPLPLFPPNNWWNLDISNAPVASNSQTFINFINQNSTTPPGRRLHPDFGGNDLDNPGYTYGIPYLVVESSQAKKSVQFLYDDQSDGVTHGPETSFPFYPIPDQAISQMGWVENGPPGSVDLRDEADRHILIVDKSSNHLYELWNCYYDGAQWFAGSGAFFDMNTNDRRPDTWTSADAAGLAILPGLIRYDEVYGPDEIRHALRVTVRATNGYVYPASHQAGSTANALPMGARLRLKADKNISGFPAEMQKIFRAFKKYGLIVADNGSDLYVGGTYDTRWNNDVLNPAFHALHADDFEVIQLGWNPAITFVLSVASPAGSGDATTATLTAYNANYTVATGYSGTVHFTSTDGIATLPTNYTFTGADAGTHTFALTLRTTGSQIVTVTDTVDPTITTTAGVTVGPATPAGLVATAASSALVNLSWNASSGATQYEIHRAGTGSALAPIGTTASTNFADGTVTASSAYVYKVRAVDASSRKSPLSTPDVATTFTFSDDPLIPTATAVKAAHVTELRNAANAIRGVAGLSATPFTDAALAAGIAAKALHVTELRTAIAQARATLGMSAATFTDPALAAGTPIKATHVQELRNLLR